MGGSARRVVYLPGCGLTWGFVLAAGLDEGLVTGLYAVRNPDKFSHLGQETTLRR